MFYGRQEQMGQLNRLLHKQVSSLVTCRGRRRVGKSTLIEHFARESGARLIKLEGIKPKAKYTNEHELRSFAEQLAVQTGADSSTPSNWLNAFVRLDREIRDDGRWTVVMLDEIAWLGYYDPMFSDTVRIAWENYWKRHDRLIVVICGSVSSWIKENIIDNKAFRGRRSLDMIVPELPLSECIKFWGDRATRIDLKEIIDVLSVTGGVPMYLQEMIRPCLLTRTSGSWLIRPTPSYESISTICLPMSLPSSRFSQDGYCGVWSKDLERSRRLRRSWALRRAGASRMQWIAWPRLGWFRLMWDRILKPALLCANDAIGCATTIRGTISS